LLSLWFCPAKPEEGIFGETSPVEKVQFDEGVFETVKLKYPVMANALRDDVDLLNWRHKGFLQSLPPQLNLQFEGIKFLLVHGSPRKNNEDILPDLSLEKVEEMLENVDANVIVCGHTHLPCGFQTSKKQTVVNVGSVGRPFTNEPKSCYLKLTIENGKCLFEHRFVEYDKEKASQKLRKREFEDADKLADMLLNPTVRHF
jgi:predicted phosphodiesterase